MKKIAIMQPYLFPYIGYFQLINAVDKFILYDDVTYIKQGWINRNNILIGGKASMFTLPLVGASTNKLIYEISVGDLKFWKKAFLKTIEQNYNKAQYFSPTMDLLKTILNSNFQNISQLCYYSLNFILNYLDINTKLEETSRIYKNQELKSQDRVIDICIKEKAEQYINPIGGSMLYSKSKFADKGIDLIFLKSQPIKYNQFNSSFVPWLSIIDIMMFNSPISIKYILEQFDLI